VPGIKPNRCQVIFHPVVIPARFGFVPAALEIASTAGRVARSARLAY
jgi:hypothetical protein